jgi:hypothetical protein
VINIEINFDEKNDNLNNLEPFKNNPHKLSLNFKNSENSISVGKTTRIHQKTKILTVLINCLTSHTPQTSSKAAAPPARFSLSSCFPILEANPLCSPAKSLYLHSKAKVKEAEAFCCVCNERRIFLNASLLLSCLSFFSGGAADINHRQIRK